MIEETILLGSVASLAAGLATGAGALPVLFTMKISEWLLDIMPGFSAGVMLATFGLIIGFVIMMLLDCIFA